MERAFSLTSRLVPLVLNTIGVIDCVTGHLQANFSQNLPGLANAFSTFGSLMHKYQPTRFDPATNGGRPFSLRDFYTKPELEDLDIYQEVYRPMSFQDHCFVHIRTTPGTTVYIGLLRDKGAFNANDKRVLKLLQPHLSNARQLALATTAVSDLTLSPEIFASVGFTTRESDVIYWLTQGKSNDEIAATLSIRADSVSRNLQSIYAKMGVEHRVAAALHALALAKHIHAETLAHTGGAVKLGVPTRRGLN